MTEELINLTKWALENLCSKCGHLRTASEISASAFLRHTCLFSSQQVCCPRRRGGTTMLLRQTGLCYMANLLLERQKFHIYSLCLEVVGLQHIQSKHLLHLHYLWLT